MNITKFGHCCLLIEEQGVRILTDPGVYSVGQDEVENLDAVLISHEHPDHLHIESLKMICAKNPNIDVITNREVGALLAAENIAFRIIEDGESFMVKSIPVTGLGKTHALLFEGIPSCANVGFLIAGRFFYPGDAFTNPGQPVEILALPVSAPWLSIADSVSYALEVRPKMIIPVHDGNMLNPGGAHGVPKTVFAAEGIPISFLELGREYEF